MALSWTEVRAKFKSPLRVVCRCLWQRFRRCVRKCERLKQERDEARREVARQDVEIAGQQEELSELRDRVRKLEVENRRLATAPCRLPDDPPLESHKFGLRMICLAVNLARVAGLRPFGNRHSRHRSPADRQEYCAGQYRP